MKEYMNASLAPRERAELLLKEMNLDEKMAQLVGVFAFKGAEDRMAAFFRHGIGQISSLEFRSCDSLDEIASWQRQLQTIVLENSRLGIPVVFHMEGLCGPLMQDTTTFPSGVARGSSFDPGLERKIGEDFRKGQEHRRMRRHGNRSALYQGCIRIHDPAFQGAAGLCPGGAAARRGKKGDLHPSAQPDGLSG